MFIASRLRHSAAKKYRKQQYRRDSLIHLVILVINCKGKNNPQIDKE
jgi:hypothetical protein